MGYSKGVIFIENQMISISDLRKVSGIGNKTIERIKERLEQNELDKQYVSKYDEGLHLDANEVHLGDCLGLMNGIPDKSVDMILCDLPYGTTQNKWDSVIDLNKLWKQYSRIIKDDGVIVLTAQTPFDKVLGSSNLPMLKYEWIWNKSKPTGHLNAKKMPMKEHENILVFYKSPPTYNCSTLVRVDKMVSRTNRGNYGECSNTTLQEFTGYPKSILKYNSIPTKNQMHTTQKPLDLFEYLIKTYTNEGDLILDNCIGSGTTAVSAINTNRNYIGIEMDEDYYKIANNRINEHLVKQM